MEVKEERKRGRKKIRSYTKNHLLIDLRVRQKWTRMDSSFGNQAKLARTHGITGYTGTAVQNVKLLSLLIEGTQQKTTPLPALRSGEGIVDWMKRTGMDASFGNRAKLVRGSK